jgi:hypothetical protein
MQIWQSNWPIILGTSSDTKPTGSLYIGYRFLATDTGNWYVLREDGATWDSFVYPTSGGGGGGGGAVYPDSTHWSLTGTSANANITNPIIGSATGGTAATSSVDVGGIYDSTPPTLSNGQQASLQLDVNGNLLANIKALPALPAGSNTIGTVGLAAGSNAIGSVIGQRTFEAILPITRPANTTAYAAGQVISTATSALTAFPTFALGIGNSQRFTINDVQLISSNGSASTKLQASLFLFSSASPSGGGFNDASTFAPTAAALGASGNALLGILPSSITQMGTAAYGISLLNQSLQGQTDSSGNVYCALVAANAYTPANAETFYIKVTGTY